MPTFSIAAGGDDGQRYRSAGLYANVSADGTGGGELTQTKLYATRETGFYITVILLRWDTSSIPDGDTVTAATLDVYVETETNNPDGLSLVADWYDAGGTQNNADWANLDSGANAISGVTIASLTEGAVNSLTLSNAAANINKTGFTGLRLGISKRAADAAPTGFNAVVISALEHATNVEPKLVVVASAPTTQYGSTSMALTTGFTTAGYAKKTGATATSLTVGFTTAGFAKKTGSVTRPLSIAYTTAGTAKRLGSVSFPIAATYATAAFAKKTGSVTLPLAVGFTTAGYALKYGVTTYPLTIGYTTAGAISGTTKYGSATSNLTIAYTTAGFATKTSSVTFPLTTIYTTAGFAIRRSSLTRPLTITYTTNGNEPVCFTYAGDDTPATTYAAAGAFAYAGRPGNTTYEGEC